MKIRSTITLDDYATTLIRLKARQLVGHYGFTQSDRDDIEQELTLDLLTRLDRFDARKGRPATFVRLVVDRCVASMIRHRTSQARDYRRVTHSLDELAGEGRADALIDPDSNADSRRDLQIDVKAALDSLPRDLRLIARSLQRGTVTAIARRRGCRRETIWQQIARIRAHFMRCGLDVYVSSRPASCGRRK